MCKDSWGYVTLHFFIVTPPHTETELLEALEKTLTPKNTFLFHHMYLDFYIYIH